MKIKRSFYPIETGSRYFKWSANVLAHPFYSVGISLIFVATPWLGVVKDISILDSAQYGAIYLSVMILSVLAAIGLPIVIKMNRFWIIKKEVEGSIENLPIDGDTLIIGAGGGSFFLIGFILKYWQETRPNMRPPSTISVSLNYEENQRVYYPSLQQIETLVDKKKILIVITTIGTGKMARKMFDWAQNLENVDEVNLFSLLVSQEAANSGEWSDVYTLSVVDRNDKSKSIVPWVRTTKIR